MKQRLSRWDRYLGMTAPMTQVPVPTANTEMLNHGKYLAEAFVVSKIIPIFVADKQ